MDLIDYALPFTMYHIRRGRQLFLNNFQNTLARLNGSDARRKSEKIKVSKYLQLKF